MESLEMTVEKRDQFKECNNLGIPLEDFRLQFCERCLARDCTRSQAGKSKFEQRTSTWEERLFTNVPRLDPGDPRVEVIQAKRFREASQRGPYEVQSSWDDPRDLTESSEPEAPVEVDSVETPEEEHEASPLEVPVEVPEGSPSLQFANTPNRPGLMVGGKKVDKQAASPVLDPWEPKKATADDVVVVKPGARVRMGGSGV